MFNAWFFLMLAFALADWFAVAQHLGRVRFITKPLVLVLLIVWFFSAGAWQGPGLVVVVALFFSLLGDIFLLKELVQARPFFFQLGLLSFLVTQMLYVVVFNRPISSISLAAPAITAAVAAASFINARYILPSLRASPAGQAMVPPVVVYMLAISLMLASALSALPRADWQPASAMLLAVGALLFYISDSLIAHNTFACAIRGADLLVTVTYHLGQFAIIAGLISNAGAFF